MCCFACVLLPRCTAARTSAGQSCILLFTGLSWDRLFLSEVTESSIGALSLWCCGAHVSTTAV